MAQPNEMDVVWDDSDLVWDDQPTQATSVGKKPTGSFSEILKLFKQTERARRAGLPFELNPDNPMINPMSVVPGNVLPSSAALAGGVAGQMVPLPFASTLMTALGNLSGQGEVQRRQIEAGAQPQSTDYATPAVEAGTTLATAGLAKLLAPIMRGVPYTKVFGGGQRFATALEKSPATVNLADEAETLARARAGVNPALRRQVLSKAEQAYGNVTGTNPIEDLLNARGQVPVAKAHDVANLADQSLARSWAEKIGEAQRGGNELRQLGLKASINRKIQEAAPELAQLYKNYSMGKNIEEAVSLLNPLGWPLKLLRAAKVMR